MSNCCANGCRYYDGVYSVDGIATCLRKGLVVKASDICEGYLPASNFSENSTHNKTIDELRDRLKKLEEDAMDKLIEKQIENMNTGIGALAEITGIFYTSLGSVPGLNTLEAEVDRHILTKTFVDSFMDHIFNPGGKNGND